MDTYFSGRGARAASSVVSRTFAEHCGVRLERSEVTFLISGQARTEKQLKAAYVVRSHVKVA